MRVLFLAIGNVRRKTVLTAAREVLADGGTVTILVGSPKRWRTEDVPDEAELVSITKLEREHLPLRLEHAALYGLPRRVTRVVGRGSLSDQATRFGKAYERRIAAPVHRGMTKLYHRLWKDRRANRVLRFAAEGRYDYVSVTDYLSIPSGALLMASADAGTWRGSVGFDLDRIDERVLTAEAR
jgi:hypothetical protein